jgi:hypothetical protein
VQIDLRCTSDVGVFVFGDPAHLTPFRDLSMETFPALYEATTAGNVFTFGGGDDEVSIRLCVAEDLPADLLQRSNGAVVAGVLRVPSGKLAAIGTRDEVSVAPGLYETKAIELDFGDKPADLSWNAARAASPLGWLLSVIATALCVIGALPTLGAFFFFVTSLITRSHVGGELFVRFGPWIAAWWFVGIGLFFLPPTRKASEAGERARTAVPTAAVALQRIDGEEGARRGYALGEIFRGADRWARPPLREGRFEFDVAAPRGITAFFDPTQLAPQVSPTYEAWLECIGERVARGQLVTHVREAGSFGLHLVVIDEPPDPDLERRQLGDRASGVLHLPSGRLACADVDRAGLALESEAPGEPAQDRAVPAGSYAVTFFELDTDDDEGKAGDPKLPGTVLYLNRISDADARGRAGCQLQPLL